MHRNREDEVVCYFVSYQITNNNHDVVRQGSLVSREYQRPSSREGFLSIYRDIVKDIECRDIKGYGEEIHIVSFSKVL